MLCLPVSGFLCLSAVNAEHVDHTEFTGPPPLHTVADEFVVLTSENHSDAVKTELSDESHWALWRTMGNTFHIFIQAIVNIKNID